MDKQRDDSKLKRYVKEFANDTINNVKESLNDDPIIIEMVERIMKILNLYLRYEITSFEAVELICKAKRDAEEKLYS